MKYTKENFEKVYDKITEIYSLASNGNFTLKAVRSMLMLLKNNMYIAMETTNELELKSYWYLKGFGKTLQKNLKRLRKRIIDRSKCKHYGSWDGFDSYFRCIKHEGDRCPIDCEDYGPWIITKNGKEVKND